MITTMCWVPQGACKYTPEVAEPPSKEEIEAVLKSGHFNSSKNIDEEEDEDEVEEMDLEKIDEVSHALAAAKALGGTSGGMQDLTDALQELDMDHYDDEDEGINVFSKGLGDAYYPSNEMDPYLIGKEDEDDEEIEDLTIKQTDNVLVCARSDDEIHHLEVLIYEELDDGETNMFVHHEVLLAAFPLCLAWLDCNLKGGDRGNFIAVGSVDPAIEIWDLDTLDEAEPLKVLGGISKKKKERKGERKPVAYRKGSHRDAVLCLAWNKQIRNVLASASADKSVKVWDVATGQCALTVKHHSKGVQAVAWNHYSPEVLLSGSFDDSVIMMDMRSNAQAVNKWDVAADVESLAWDPHSEYAFVVSLENGTVQGFDTRVVAPDSSSSRKPSFTLHAHDKAVCSVSYNPSVPNLIATGSFDKTVKLWDISNNQPSCVASKSPKAGRLFSVSFCNDSPFLLALGGTKGDLQIWDTMTDPGVAKNYGS